MHYSQFIHMMVLKICLHMQDNPAVRYNKQQHQIQEQYLVAELSESV